MLTTWSIKNRRMRPFGEFGGLSDADEVHLPRQPCTYNSNSLAKKQDYFAGNFAPFQNGRLKSCWEAAAQKKIAKNRRSGVDSHDKLWYSFVTARLVKSNQSCGGSCKTSDETPNSSIPFSFSKRKRQHGLLCRFPARHKMLLVRHLARTKSKKRDARLDHLCAPIRRFNF